MSPPHKTVGASVNWFVEFPGEPSLRIHVSSIDFAGSHGNAELSQQHYGTRFTRKPSYDGIVPVRDFQTIKLRKSIVKRCNRYDNGSYELKDVVCSELYSRREKS